MRARLLPIRFPATDEAFDLQLDRLRELLGDVAEFLDPVTLGAGTLP